MRFIQRLGLLALVLLMFAPQQVGAYSYGDPSKEVIAEAMHEMIAKLNASPPDWPGAGAVYQVHRAEIESHFAGSVASTLVADIEAQDKDRFLSNYRALLALNIGRRFEYANQGISDYSQAKLLLAKAKGTYDVLQPYVADKAVDTDIVKAFDEALEALGNPGLFGVGQKEVNAEVFKAKTDFILGKLKPLFPMAAAPKKAESEPKPSAPAKAAPEPAPKSTAPAASQPAKEPAVTEEVKQEAPAVKEAEQEVPKTASEAQAEAPAAEQSAVPTAQPTAQPAPEAAPSAPAAETVVPAANPPQTDTAAAAAHAPMERQSRTNPLISIVVIGGVAIAAACGLWFVKKRKLL